MDDKELLYLYFQGSECALEALIEKYRSILTAMLKGKYNYMLQYMEEEDLIQEAMIVFYQLIDHYRFDSLASFRTYISGCVANLWITFLRKFQTNKQRSNFGTLSFDKEYVFLSFGEGGYTLQDVIGDEHISGKPAERLYYNEAFDLIERVVKESKMEYGIDITIFKMLGYGDAEIAERLDISQKKVANTIYRIRKKVEFSND